MAPEQAQLTPPELAVEIARLFAARDIPYAVGGAIALGYYADPRGTLDVDINVFVDSTNAEPVLAALEEAGIDLPPRRTLDAVAERGDLFLQHRGCRLDLFFNSIPLHESAMGRTRRVRLLGDTIPILAPEDLILFKLLFNRPKDIADVDQMVAQHRSSMDLDYVRRWLVDCVGDDDPRLETWEAIVAAHE